ncbi:hypothetical protein BDW69DRAFT_197606 [Aspergillus filifer]
MPVVSLPQFDLNLDLPGYLVFPHFTSLPLKTIAAIAAFVSLRCLNTYLSNLAQNNRIRSSPWGPSNEIALITGGGSGIGRQIVHDLAVSGQKAVVIVIYEVTDKIELASNVHFYKVDITFPSAIVSAANTFRVSHGHPAILLNNAGIASANSIFCLSEEEIRSTQEANTLSHFWTIREFLPHMLERDHGHIVTMASMASFAVAGGSTAYSASKAALLGVHEGMSQEIRHFYKEGGEWRCKVRTRVSNAVVRQLVRRNSGQVIVPERHRVVALVRGCLGGFRNWLGIG